MNAIAYVNARLIDPASGLDSHGALLTEGGLITDLGPGLFDAGIPEGIEVVDCAGRVLCPGLIDMRVFVGEPGAEHKETLASASVAAAAGGVTCIIVQPNTEPVIDEVALVEYIKRQARDKAVVRIHPMAAITKGLCGEKMAELGLLAEADAVAFTDADRSVADAQVMRRVLSYASAFDLLICHYPEEPALAGNGVMNAGEVAMRLGLPGIPTQAETIMVERDLRLVEMTGGRYHAACLSTAQAIEALARGKARGLRVSAAAAVHNFALNETAVGEYRTFAKTAPPLRDEADRQAVVAGLADGTIDVICSCHDPQDAESKRLPFELAATGIIGLETMLPLALELYHNGAMGLSDLLAKMTCRPAQLLGLRGGKLSPGAPADLLVFDPDKPWRIDENRFHSKAKNTPYHDRPVQGRPWRTIVDGKVVYADPDSGD
ncbi:MAG: dihydroorotase [Proteobacteria bacterium]|nr:dihydroorotase [Pseudomonadota bacterium]